jgi:mono/diheme cytochrome c family protein
VTALVLLAGAALACGTGRRGSAGFQLPDGDAVRGKQVFVANRCHACHEVAGVELPAPVADPPVPVRLGGEVTRLHTDGELTTAIIHPSHRLAAGPEPALRSGARSRMGDFSETMTVRELIDLVAFLQSTYADASDDLTRWPMAHGALPRGEPTRP